MISFLKLILEGIALITQYLKNPTSIVLPLARRECFKWLSDKSFLHLAYYSKLHKRLNIDQPRLFCEKIQWLKLYDRQTEYIQMVDKFEAKQYAASIIGNEHIIPTLGVWSKFDDIDFDLLPNQFV